jgi:hypothetical protein
VGYVENDFRLAWDTFKTAGPAGVLDAAGDGGWGDGEFQLVSQLDGGGDGQGEVAVLMRALEGGIDEDLLAEHFDRVGSDGAGA